MSNRYRVSVWSHGWKHLSPLPQILVVQKNREAAPENREQRLYTVLKARSPLQTSQPEASAENSAEATSRTQLCPYDLVHETQPDSDSEFQAPE